jgi:hypothetical protein
VSLSAGNQLERFDREGHKGPEREWRVGEQSRPLRGNRAGR